MKSILLIGIGRFGENVAKKLRELGDEVMAVDRNEQNLNAITDIVTNAQIGDSTDRKFLEQLGVRNFDCCIVAIGDHFQDSVITTSLLKELGAQKVVARASSDIHEGFLRKIGADEVVCPEKQMASWTAIRYGVDHVLDYISVSADNSIYEIEMPESWAGRTIAEINVRRKYGITIVAIRLDGKITLNFGPDTVLSQDMTLLVFGENKAVMKCIE
ncbi:MAG: potassium channel family protein [Oscillospiraceae bacterium]|jgi:trk system potassium uptake protein TrkA